MKIVIITIGSRGDVQPIVALGKGLQDAGHTVTIATHGNFKGFVQEHGLIFGDIGANPKKILESQSGQDWLNSSNTIALLSRMRKLVKPFLAEAMSRSLSVCEDADIIISAVMGMFLGPYISRELGKKHVEAYLQPFHPTAAFCSIYFPEMAHIPVMQGLYNKLTSRAAFYLIWKFFEKSLLDANRQVFGHVSTKKPFYKIFQKDRLVLYGFSPSVIPRPNDWDDSIVVTGYWFLSHSRTWSAEPELLEFLERGDAPVYIGFGSMVDEKSSIITKAIVNALRVCKKRAVLLSGWGGIKAGDADVLSEDIYTVQSVPHDWLFPRTSGIIHHGGAGTTASSLRAGVTTCITPFFDDQPFWGRRVSKLQVGPPAVLHKKLTQEKLVSIIQLLTETTKYKKNARIMGEKIRKENGVKKAVNAISRIF
jgi:UDP:flavonoid glycosyltransferase YjiC (YdhE family)